jgi:acyl-CoA reductase-like NAD-dependent aldehyde dehydrogenase
MLAWKVAPALATGNTVVLKPAETTPLTALLFAEVCRQADLPPGVVNIVTGAGETGRAVVEHEDVDKVAFTGSTEVGRSIARAVGRHAQELTLELGGKAANIVFDDAPDRPGRRGIVQGIFFNQGHVLLRGSRLLVQESVHDEQIASLQRRIAPAGRDPLDKNTDIGAINSAEQLAGSRALRRRRGEGASAGSRPATARPRLLVPADGASPSRLPRHRIAREEVFGPVLSDAHPSGRPDEAVAKANNTTYGLSAGIWTEKGSRILAIADRLRAGVVWANTFNQFDPTSPFGGYKQSG